MSEYADIVAALQSRWPENQPARGLGRISRLMELLSEPQCNYPVIQIAGTNGKGSVAIIVESLLRAMGLRVGRYSSPHLEDLRQRIAIDGEPISVEAFNELVADVLPLVEMVDAERIDDTAMTFYEVMTGLAFEAFAQAPVDVAVIEVGMGGSWDATNVADAQVAVICPIDYDHTALLGTDLAQIASEKAGIIKADSVAVLAAQDPAAVKVLLDRSATVGARVLREGIEFGLLNREVAIGGQLIRVDTVEGALGDLFLPLFGLHFARNAALAIASIEAFLGGKAISAAVIEAGLVQVKAPARMEIVRRSPTIVLDTCHNPHAAKATMLAMAETFAFEPLIGVVAMMRDKDVSAVLEEFATGMSAIVTTGIKGVPRAFSADELAELATSHFTQITACETMDAAIQEAVRQADLAGVGAGILIAGSVYAAGQARALLVDSSKLVDDSLIDDSLVDDSEEESA